MFLVVFIYIVLLDAAKSAQHIAATAIEPKVDVEKG